MVGTVVTTVLVWVGVLIVVKSWSVGAVIGWKPPLGALGPLLPVWFGLVGGVRSNTPLTSRIPVNNATAAIPIPASTICRRLFRRRFMPPGRTAGTPRSVPGSR